MYSPYSDRLALYGLYNTVSGTARPEGVSHGHFSIKSHMIFRMLTAIVSCSLDYNCITMETGHSEK